MKTITQKDARYYKRRVQELEDDLRRANAKLNNPAAVGLSFGEYTSLNVGQLSGAVRCGCAIVAVPDYQNDKLAVYAVKRS